MKSKSSRSAGRPFSLEEMEVIFDELTAAVPSETWTIIVGNLNERFGTSRLNRTVKKHWKNISKAKLLASYAAENDI
jgi:hypothetical protein